MTREEYAERAQRTLWRIVGTLLDVEDAMAVLVAELPDSPTAMLESRVPDDVMMEVESGIVYRLNDNLRPMIAGLKSLATVTHADLAWRWEEARRRQIN